MLKNINELVTFLMVTSVKLKRKYADRLVNYAENV